MIIAALRGVKVSNWRLDLRATTRCTTAAGIARATSPPPLPTVSLSAYARETTYFTTLRGRGRVSRCRRRRRRFDRSGALIGARATTLHHLICSLLLLVVQLQQLLLLFLQLLLLEAGLHRQTIRF